ncbi:Mss4-like protein [Thelonectria olida]|uniref:Mss4-like protein n=1 Tax=Thelonectria olida TaxID=1576542 RepID=A0A9P9ANY9_9HYPO|nr:Mss4-like protein [Thelonectria olida]
MAAPYSGSCLCGSVRFTIVSDPVTVLSCFCNHCSKGAGGANQILAKFATKDIEVVGNEDDMAKYELKDTSSGQVKEKSFCRRCGCTLWTIPASAKGKFHLVRTALLNGGLQLQPANEIFVKNRPSWMSAIEGVPQWEEMRK